jgi:NitT/TauT family transport system substrate-binding protein
LRAGRRGPTLATVRSITIGLVSALVFLAAGCKKDSGGTGGSGNAPLRVGYFPNITHAQALVGNADGTFARHMGEGRVKMVQFNAGPSAMEALTAGSLDASFVGSGPAINTYVKAGKELRIISGAVNGGAVFVTKTAQRPEDLVGKRVASPQIGNTQDIALRHWLKEKGLKIVQGGSDGVIVTPIANPDILGLFRSGQLEGAWVPEPWGARMIAEGGGQMFLDERELWPDGRFPTTVLVTTRKMLESRPADIQALVDANVELTKRWQQDPAAFTVKVNEAFGALTGKPLPAPVLQDAFSRIQPSLDPVPPVLAEVARQAKDLGYLPNADVSGLVDTHLVDQRRAQAR